MSKKIKQALALAAICGAGFVTYAYFGDTLPNQVEVAIPVTLHAN